MTKNLATLILLLISISCSPKIETEVNRNAKPSKDFFQKLSNTSKGIYPIKITFKGIGLNESSGEPRSILINSDSVWVNLPSKLDTFTIVTEIGKTEFPELLQNISKKNLEEDKHYVHPFIRDGGTTIIKTKYGEKKFTNVFGRKDFEHITPDTIGMMKFESLVNYAGRFTNEIKRKEKPVSKSLRQ